MKSSCASMLPSCSTPDGLRPFLGGRASRPPSDRFYPRRRAGCPPSDSLACASGSIRCTRRGQTPLRSRLMARSPAGGLPDGWPTSFRWVAHLFRGGFAISSPQHRRFAQALSRGHGLRNREPKFGNLASRHLAYPLSVSALEGGQDARPPIPSLALRAQSVVRDGAQRPCLRSRLRARPPMSSSGHLPGAFGTADVDDQRFDGRLHAGAATLGSHVGLQQLA
jgi:hypothetical protein